MAIGRGEVKGFTVPAINVRMLAYDFARAICARAVAEDVGAVIFELARSEIGYTEQRPAEFAAVIGRLSDTGHFGSARVCEAFVGRAELQMGARVEEVIGALAHASDGRLRGIRSPTNWDPDPGINPSKRGFAPQGIMSDSGFREGLARLARHGLVYDAWQYYPQLGELGELADADPDATIVCDSRRTNRADVEFHLANRAPAMSPTAVSLHG